MKVRTNTGVLLAALALGAVSITAAGEVAAGGATDTTPPRVWAPATGSFVVGSQITTTLIADDYSYSFMPLRLRWFGNDASGICGYSLYAQPAGAAPFPVFENELRTSFVVTGNEYNGDFGGGSTLIAYWYVTATDCAGNTSAPEEIPNLIRTLQDDNTSSTLAPGEFTYRRAWRVSNCDCWSGGTTHKTYRRGAKATYTASFATGDHVGLVMATGPDRGKAKVYVDGRYRATIDTYSPTREHRQVVWQSWMRAGTHSVTVKNLATPGRRRIDVDAVVLAEVSFFD